MTYDYARPGCMFFHVSTPCAFREIELPFETYAWTPQQRRQYESLEALADRHCAPVTSTHYRIG